MEPPLRIFVSWVLAVSIIWAAPTSADADEKDIDLAKQYYVLGEKLYKRSDFKGAAVQFEKSYAHSKRPELLFNIAHCHESMGEFQLAIDHYERYLKSDPENAAIVRARIKNLKRALQERRKPDPAPTPKPTPAPQPQPELARPYWIPGWVLVGTGAALCITGAALGAVAAGKAGELEDASRLGTRPDFSEYASTEDAGKGLELGQIVTLAVGGAALATGAVLLILDRVGGPEPNERSAWIAPSVGPGMAGVAGGVRF